jgi:hypothetical protein
MSAPAFPSLQIFRSEAEYGFGSADFNEINFSASTFTGPLSLQGQTNLVGGFYPDFLIGGLTGCLFEAEECDCDDNDSEEIPGIDPPIVPGCFSPVTQREFWNVNIRMIRGDTLKFDFTVLDDQNDPINLTNAELRFTAKWRFSDADASAVIRKDNLLLGGITVTDAVNGKAQLKTLPGDTSGLPAYKTELYYDIQVETSLGEVYTPLRGILIIEPDATITT